MITLVQNAGRVVRHLRCSRTLINALQGPSLHASTRVSAPIVNMQRRNKAFRTHSTRASTFANPSGLPDTQQTVQAEDGKNTPDVWWVVTTAFKTSLIWLGTIFGLVVALLKQYELVSHTHH